MSSSSSKTVKAPQHVEMIQHFFLTTEDKDLNLLNFYNLNAQYIISNTNQWDVKRTWTKRFFDVAKKLNVDILEDAPQPDWEEVRRLVFEFMSRKSQEPTAVTPRKRTNSLSAATSSTSATKKSSSSATTTSAVENLTPSCYDALAATFDNFDNSKKWKLTGGAFVEDVLYEYAQSRPLENLCHSFVINVKDSMLKAKFKDSWREVINENCKTLPALPDHLFHHLQEISSMQSYHDVDAFPNFSWLTDKDLNISTTCLRLIANIYRSRFFARSKLLEYDICVNVWSMLDQVVNAYNLQAKRSEPCSIASTARRNRDRSIQEMQRKKTGRKSDLIICTEGGLEVGCGEAGLEDEDFDTKVMVESNLKTPKIMHDMFVRLCASVDNKQAEVKKLQVVGLVFSRFKIRMLIMDSPKGYTCRLRFTQSAAFTGVEESFGTDFRRVYQLIWMCKEICKGTERIVEEYKATTDIGFEAEDTSDNEIVALPDSLRSPKRD